jgi:seryl-tRNA synthetase
MLNGTLDQIHVHKVIKNSATQVEYCHMLNGTMCAVTRVMCALLETHQTAEGIRIPAPLAAWLPPDLRDIIPFVNPPLCQGEKQKKTTNVC